MMFMGFLFVYIFEMSLCNEIIIYLDRLVCDFLLVIRKYDVKGLNC